jgi:WXG100 family type VII secretion target
MARIIIPPPKLRAHAQSIEASAQVIEREVRDAHQVVTALRATFIGDRATDFFKDFEQAYQCMQQWDDLIRHFACHLKAIADEFDKVDHNFS